MDDVASFCRDVYPRLARGLGAHSGDRWVGEELAQEALARVWERWSRVRSYDSPEAWVWRVGINLASSRLRRQRAEHRALQKMQAVAPEAAADADDALALRAALAALPRRQRDAVVLRYIGDLSVADAAAALGCAEGTVKALTSQGIDNLRTAFGASEGATRGE